MYHVKIYNNGELVHEEDEMFGIELTSDLGHQIQELPSREFDRVVVERTDL